MVTTAACRIPSSYELPGFNASVFPILVAPLLSWMWPWRDNIGWNRLIASWTDVEPTGLIACPPETYVRSSFRAGALSSFDPYGGAWKLKIVVSGSEAAASAVSIRSASCGSSASRNVCHGVGFVQPIETIVNSPSWIG